MAATPLRSIRVPDDAWARWRAEADRQGVTVSEYIRCRVDGVAPTVARGPRDLAVAEVTPRFKTPAAEKKRR